MPATWLVNCRDRSNVAVQLALGLVQIFGGFERGGEGLVAGLFVGADVFAEAGHFLGQSLVVLSAWRRRRPSRRGAPP